jgi:hypothetical protein
VGRTNKKYALDRPTLLTLWHVQEGTNFIQIEMLTLKEVGFLFLEKPICPLINLVGDDIYALVKQPLKCGDITFALVYKPLDPNAWPKSRNGKKIHHLNTFKLSII